jgi:hypothetical protein
MEMTKSQAQEWNGRQEGGMEDNEKNGRQD